MIVSDIWHVYGFYKKSNNETGCELCYVCENENQADKQGKYLLSLDEIMGIKYVDYDIECRKKINLFKTN